MTPRRTHPRSRPLPEPVDPGLPDHLKRITMTAMLGTVRAPIGSSMAQIYLASARALIDEAIAMERGR